MPDLSDLFGDVIHAYTRAQAIADGVLVDVSGTAKEAGFTVPVALTRGAWEDLVAWDNDVEAAYQDESGRLWDVLWMTRFAITSKGGDGIDVELQRIPRGGRRAMHTKVFAHIGPGDLAEPVITIMLPGEY